MRRWLHDLYGVQQLHRLQQLYAVLQLLRVQQLHQLQQLHVDLRDHEHVIAVICPTGRRGAARPSSCLPSGASLLGRRISHASTELTDTTMQHAPLRTPPSTSDVRHADHIVTVTLRPALRPARLAETLGPLTGAGVRVAVVDSGWDERLVVSGMRLEPGVSICGSAQPAVGRETNDRIGHGTACMTTVHRLAPGAALCPVRVFDDSLNTSILRLIAALRWAIRQEVDIINLSLFTARRDALRALYAVCEEARRRGIVIVAASPEDAASFPAAFENVLSVTSGPFDDPFDYEYRRNSRIECVAACGVQRRAVTLGGRVIHLDRPSYAAPTITGIVALLREQHPHAPLEAIRELLSHHAIATEGDEC